MKKFIAILLVVMLMAIPFTALAHSDNTNAGTIPKTATAPVIDGVKDAIYDQGLFLPVRNPHNATPDGGLGGGADAWLLWDDNFIYVFMNVDVKKFDTTDDYEDKQVDEPWALTTIEVLIDFSNVADAGTDVSQFRLNDRGFPNVTIGRGNVEWVNGDECKPYGEFKGVKGTNSYTGEFKIDIKGVQSAFPGGDMNFGDAFGAGKKIGLYLFAQENGDGEQALFISVPTDQSGNWNPTVYDYVVLGDKVVSIAAPEPVVVDTPADAPAPVEAAPAPAAPKPAAPKTGDVGIIVLVAVMSAAGIVLFRKKAVK